MAELSPMDIEKGLQSRAYKEYLFKGCEPPDELIAALFYYGLEANGNDKWNDQNYAIACDLAEALKVYPPLSRISKLCLDRAFFESEYNKMIEKGLPKKGPINQAKALEMAQQFNAKYIEQLQRWNMLQGVAKGENPYQIFTDNLLDMQGSDSPQPADFRKLKGRGGPAGFIPKFAPSFKKTYHGIWGITILTGRSEDGKSLLALTCARDFIQQGVSCLYYSLEMPQADLMTRLLAMETGKSLKTAFSEMEELRDKHIKDLEIYGEHLFIKSSFDIDKLTFEVEAVKAKNEKKAVFVVIDYLQEIPMNSKLSLKEKVDYLLARIREICNYVNSSGKIVFLILSNMTKEESRPIDDTGYDEDEKLIGQLISSGMGSANIRYSADMQLSLVRHPNKDEYRSKIFVLKNRNGSKPEKGIELMFDKRGRLNEEEQEATSKNKDSFYT